MAHAQRTLTRTITHSRSHSRLGWLRECRATDCRAAMNPFGFFRLRSPSLRPPPSALRRWPSAASAVAGRSREMPKRQRWQRFESPLGAVHHANRLKSAAAPGPARRPAQPLPPRRRAHRPAPGKGTPSLHPIHTQLCCLSTSLSNPGPRGAPPSHGSLCNHRHRKAETAPCLYPAEIQTLKQRSGLVP